MNLFYFPKGIISWEDQRSPDRSILLKLWKHFVFVLVMLEPSSHSVYLENIRILEQLLGKLKLVCEIKRVAIRTVCFLSKHKLIACSWSFSSMFCLNEYWLRPQTTLRGSTESSLGKLIKIRSWSPRGHLLIKGFLDSVILPKDLWKLWEGKLIGEKKSCYSNKMNGMTLNFKM